MKTKQQWKSLYGRYRKVTRGAYLIRHGYARACQYTREIREFTGRRRYIPTRQRVAYGYIEHRQYRPTSDARRWYATH